MSASEDLYADPLAYPGRPEPTSGVLTGQVFDPGAQSELLGRQPVLAVGANASPGQVSRKMAGLPQPVVVPFTQVTVHNLVAGVSAHVSRPGYIPASPVIVSGAESHLTVNWLTVDQLAAMDDTEPNYERLPLPGNVLVRRCDDVGVTLDSCDAYVSKRGYLVHADGSPRLLTHQRELITSLLRESTALRALAGATPDAFVTSMSDPATRGRVHELFRSEGWVRDRSAG